MTGIRAWAADRESAGLRRWLQVGLGVLWVLDAALQYQPYMFGRGFVTDIIDPAGAGSPALIANSVTGAGHLMLHNVVLFNAVFATIQLALGVGLLWRPTVRAALAGTAVWGLGVWFLGEGAGGILTGSASPLTGAPGAALLYVLLAVLVWPGRARPGRDLAGRGAAGSVAAASVAAGSPLGGRWSRLPWLLLWAGSGYFLLQGQVRAPGVLRSTIAGLADGEPGWLASLDRDVAAAVGSGGGVISIALAAAFVLIGIAVYLPAVTRPALILAVISAAALWVLAENLGGIFTGTGTDPNTGPLLILLAAAYWPLAGRRAQHRAAAQPPASAQVSDPQTAVTTAG
jgi:hypothetical protein